MFNKMTIARPYAKAVYQVAKEGNTVPAWDVFLTNLVALTRDPTLMSWVLSPSFDQDTFIDAVFSMESFRSSSVEMKSFLRVLSSAQNRFSLMPLILESFEEERSMDSGIFSAQVVSAFPMSELDLVSIKPLLKEKFGSDLKFSFDIDPTLLGGFVVSVKDKVLDFSLKGRLSGLRHTLLA